jgi:nicotinamide riboside kinase
VPDATRSVIDAAGGALTYGHIERIGRDHADAILAAKPRASRFLFTDADIESIGMHSLRYFGKVPDFPPWVTSAALFDLYLLCDNDATGIRHPASNSTNPILTSTSSSLPYFR